MKSKFIIESRIFSQIFLGACLVLSPCLGVCQARPIDLEEEEKEAKVPAAFPTEHLTSSEELSLWEYQIAEREYLSSETQENTDRVIRALQKLVYSRCFIPHKDAVGYKIPGLGDTPADDHCDRYRTKLLSLYPGSAAGICARDGLESSSCLQAERKIKVKPGSPKDLNPEDATKDKVNLARNADRLRKAISVLSSLLSSLPSNARGLTSETRAAYRDALRASCVYARSSFPLEPITPEPTPRPLEEFIGKLPTPTPVPAASQKVSYERKEIKYLPFDCINLAQEASRRDPAFAAPTCALMGAYSPRCIQARREDAGPILDTETSLEQKDPSSVGNQKTSGSSGNLESF